MDKEIKWPEVIFGTSGLGNLYEAVPFEQKRAIVKACLQHSEKPVCFDSAGKYGAGLALEALGRLLKELGVNREEVLISNKLGWLFGFLRSTSFRSLPSFPWSLHAQ